ncbi:MAG: cytochrome bd ubiquinol oxidase subunit, partial [Microbacteriaceae bacterium]|nr:cytochrome bd ubiquinol oxidase subunit [Microbacteriaceae bacterium]
VRLAGNRFAGRVSPIAVLPLLAWALIVQFSSGSPLSWALVVVAVAAVIVAWSANRGGSEGLAFVGFGLFLVAAMAAIFLARYPVVLPSTISTRFDLTVASASSAPYTLGVMSVVACFGIPLVLAYQGWTYWVFRKRVSASHIPAAHPVEPAVRRA